MRITGIILIAGLLFSGCRTESRTEASRAVCQYSALVVDKSDLDGCRMLFQLRDDELLNPVEWTDPQPEIIVGEQYIIDYQEIPVANICMAGKTVRITCITSAE